MPADLLVDPRTSEAATYVAAVLGALILGTLLLVTALSALGRGGVSPRTLYARWFTWAILGPIFAVACLSGLLPVVVLMALFAVQGVREWSRLVGLPAGHRLLLMTYAVVAVGLAMFGAPALLASIPLLLIGSTLQPILEADVRSGMRSLAFGALGFAYLPLLLAFPVLVVRDIAAGPAILFATGVAIAFSDIGAYAVGKTIGRHRLAPTISPNKTVEGTLGNLIGAVAGYALFWPILPALPAWFLALLPIVVALGAIWGDLFKSVAKREFGVKDAGTLLPGFGGILDRIDSFIMVVPLVYYLFRVLAAGLDPGAVLDLGAGSAVATLFGAGTS